MNAEERQELREKHSVDLYALASRMTICVGCCMDYPCDVIKVLDATESEFTDIRASATSDVLPVSDNMTMDCSTFVSWCYKQENECNHIIGYRHSQCDAYLIDLDDDLEPNTLFDFCPKCGVRL